MDHSGDPRCPTAWKTGYKLMPFCPPRITDRQPPQTPLCAISLYRKKIRVRLILRIFQDMV